MGRNCWAGARKIVIGTNILLRMLKVGDVIMKNHQNGSDVITVDATRLDPCLCPTHSANSLLQDLGIFLHPISPKIAPCLPFPEISCAYPPRVFHKPSVIRTIITTPFHLELAKVLPCTDSISRTKALAQLEQSSPFDKGPALQSSAVCVIVNGQEEHDKISYTRC